MHLMTERFIFWGWLLGVFWKRKTAVHPEDRFANIHDFFRLLEDRLGQLSNGTSVVYLMEPMALLNLPTFFLSSRL